MLLKSPKIYNAIRLFTILIYMNNKIVRYIFDIFCKYTYKVNLFSASGHNLKIIQRQLGHASITTSSVYLSVQEEELNEAVEKL